MPKGYVIARVDVIDPEAYAQIRRRRDQGDRRPRRQGAGARRPVRGARRQGARAQRRARVRQLRGGERRYFYPRNIRPRDALREGAAEIEWCWSRASDWPKATGSPTSMSPTPTATRTISPPTGRLRQIRRALPGARRAHARQGRRAARPPGGHRIQGLRDRVRLLRFAGVSARVGVSRRGRLVDLVIVEGYDGPQPG